MSQPTNSNPPTGSYSPGYGYPNQQYFPEEKPVNWRKYLFLFLSNWYWFLIALGLAMAIAFFKIRYTIPVYQATATIIVEEDENNQDVLSGLRAFRYWRRQTDMANERAKLSSYSIINRTVDSLHQEIFWTAHGRIRVRHLYSSPRYNLLVLSDPDSVNWYMGQEWYIDYINDQEYRLYQEGATDTILALDTKVNLIDWKFIISLIDDAGHDTYSFKYNDPNVLTRQYKNKLQIETDEKTGTVITLRSQGPVGEREVDFLNMLSKTYILSGLERKQQIAENTFVFIDNQIEVILDSLHRAEEQLLTFRLTNNVINLSREGEMAYERLKSFHEQRTQLELKENYYDYLKKYIEERNDPQTIIAPTLADANDQLLIGAVQELQQLYEERENLDISVQKDNPGLESINKRIQSIRLRIIEIVKGLIENNRLTLEQLDTEEQAILNQLKKLPLNEQQLLNIKRKHDLYNQFYTFLLEKRAEAGIQKASTISNVRILDPARHDHLTPVGSDKKIIILIALVLGLLIPAGIIILRDLIDGTIREMEDITQHSEIPVMGIIGHSTRGETLIDKENPNSVFTELLRRIRSNLQFMLRDPGQKVIMVTSSISGEGKTFTATNLATIFAMNNKKVLLIGCDMRKPALHRIFHMENTTGLSSVIIGKTGIEASIFDTTVENLFLLPSGPIPPNPAELLETEEMEQLLLQLKQKYDFIILDTPPVALVSDSLSLSKYADITLYVLRQNYSQGAMLKMVNQLKEEKRMPQLTLLVNDFKAKRNLGYTYYYGYNKGYNYGYYDYSKYYSEEDK
ncbi:MAG: polysaccharide biosynthesis tyrosine autokinase [Bacteroidales bacterium]|nr:polysaccharide biosynthesis tyrosine autokinase [Bacteroidales bacterium]